jgi:hypothetical protein
VSGYENDKVLLSSGPASEKLQGTKKQHSINRYAAGGLTKEAYIALNLSLDVLLPGSNFILSAQQAE